MQARCALLTRDQLDGRPKAAQQFDAVARSIAEEIGGENQLSAIEKHLVEAFAGVSIHLGATAVSTMTPDHQSDFHLHLVLWAPRTIPAFGDFCLG
jgi:hypothetical protein